MADPLEALVRDHQQALATLDAKTAGQMVAQYRTSLTAIQREIDGLSARLKAAEAAGEPVSAGLVYREERYLSLQAQVEAELARWTQAASGITTLAQREALAGADAQLEAEMRAAFGEAPGVLPPAFNHLPVRQIEAMVGFAADGSPLSDLFASLNPLGADMVKRALVTGLILGRPVDRIARDIRNGLGVPLWRGLLIGRTETHRAYREAKRLGILENADALEGWVWHTARTTRTCAACWAREGQVYHIQLTTQGGTVKAAVAGMATHPACLRGDTIVTGPGAVASTARWYDGDLIEILTARGHVLACTPNHPVLTPKGWVSAGLLHKGSYIISSDLPERVAATVDPDHYQVPALIEEVASALGGPGAVSTALVPVASEDFHGDGIGSEVCVIRSNRLLRDRVDTPFRKPDAEQVFGGRNPGLPILASAGAALSFPGCGVAATTGTMGGFGVAPVLFGSAGGHHQPVSLQRVPSFDPSGAQAARDGTAPDAVSTSEGDLRLSREVAPADILNRQADTIPAGGRHAGHTSVAGHSRVAPQATFPEKTAESRGISADDPRSITDALAGQVQLDRVVKISRARWQGHVYNLETVTGWYIANGIITHNCRCTLSPRAKSYADIVGDPSLEDSRPPIPTGEDLFAKLTPEQRLRILGPGKAALYESGQISLSDLARSTRSPIWGNGIREATLGELREGIGA